MNAPTTPTALLRASLLAITLLAGCQRAPLNGPPEVHLGRDSCGHCGMIISEDRCCGALLIDDQGEREHVIFDDIGCMLDYRTDHTKTPVIGSFVHDYSTRTWVDGTRAYYLATTDGKVATPMGSGIIAFVDKATAEAKQKESGGEVLDFPALERKQQAASQPHNP